MDKLYLIDKAPKQTANGAWTKTIKDRPDSAASLAVVAYGDTKKQAEELAQNIVALPELIKTLQNIWAWNEYQDHKIGQMVKNALSLTTFPVKKIE